MNKDELTPLGDHKRTFEWIDKKNIEYVSEQVNKVLLDLLNRHVHVNVSCVESTYPNFERAIIICTYFLGHRLLFQLFVKSFATLAVVFSLL